jgi:AcrR family transcriptional regulator
MAEVRKSVDTLRDRLLATAELLFARHGVTGVSLRQISAAAGTRNNYAVQYHFGDIDGLIRAILERRAPMLDGKRGDLLTQCVGREPLSVRTLIEIFHRPMLEPESSGEPSVSARFELAILASRNGLERLDEAFSMMPVTRHLMELISIANHPVPAPITWRRMEYVALTVLTAGVSAYNTQDTPAYYQAALNDAFNMAAAALATPVEDSATLLGDASDYVARWPTA